MIRRCLGYGLMMAVLFGFWHTLGRPRPVAAPEPSPGKRLQSVSYAPFDTVESPLEAGPEGPILSHARIDTDLAILARRFEGIRTYSALGMAAVPVLAEKHGLKVMLGAWVSADPVATRRELVEVIDLARRYRSCVKAVVVGNEALLRRRPFLERFGNLAALIALHRLAVIALALMATLVALVFYNVGLAAVAIVPAGLVLARHKLDADIPAVIPMPVVIDEAKIP
jgi:hypothetical protein